MRRFFGCGLKAYAWVACVLLVPSLTLNMFGWKYVYLFDVLPFFAGRTADPGCADEEIIADVRGGDPVPWIRLVRECLHDPEHVRLLLYTYPGGDPLLYVEHDIQRTGTPHSRTVRVRIKNLPHTYDPSPSIVLMDNP